LVSSLINYGSDRLDAFDYKLILAILIFIVLVFTLQLAFFSDEIITVDPLDSFKVETRPEFGFLQIPVIIAVYIGSFFTIIWNMMTFNVEGVPLIVRIIIMLPIWLAIIFLIYRLAMRSAEAIGQLIPFTMVIK
jgi:hypothetical protein